MDGTCKLAFMDCRQRQRKIGAISSEVCKKCALKLTKYDEKMNFPFFYGTIFYSATKDTTKPSICRKKTHSSCKNMSPFDNWKRGFIDEKN